MFANLAPSQEPALWGALTTALLGLVVVFLPRFGVTLSKDEYTAIAAVAVAAIPIVVGLLVRQNTTPTAPPPGPPPVKP
jgi:hypothetical protein